MEKEVKYTKLGVYVSSPTLPRAELRTESTHSFSYNNLNMYFSSYICNLDSDG